EATLRRIGVAAQVRALTIYNAVEEALTPDGTPVDERKLIFFSSPNKGLNFTLDAFSALKRRMPDLRLVVGNPGYKAGGDARRAGRPAVTLAAAAGAARGERRAVRCLSGAHPRLAQRGATAHRPGSAFSPEHGYGAVARAAVFLRALPAAAAGAARASAAAPSAHHAANTVSTEI